MNLHHACVPTLVLAAVVALPASPTQAEASPVSIDVTAPTCVDGAARATLTLVNTMLTEDGGTTVFAVEYSVDGGDWEQLAVWSAAFDGYDEPVINVGEGSVDVQYSASLTYRLRLGPESDLFVDEQTVGNPCAPTTRAECRSGGYVAFGFDSQRDCYAFLRG